MICQGLWLAVVTLTCITCGLALVVVGHALVVLIRDLWLEEW